LGKDTFWLKLQAFTIGCGIIGLAGAFLAVYSRSISTDQFVPFTTFSVFVVVLLGGSGNNKGVVIGAAIFFLFDWLSIRLKDYLPPSIADRVAYYRLIAIGLILILLVMYRPQGILPEPRYRPRAR
jgi:ABC-type branched-subunit amino acid transport system permease subunit